MCYFGYEYIIDFCLLFAVLFDFQGASAFVLHLAGALEDQGQNWVGKGVVISVRVWCILGACTDQWKLVVRCVLRACWLPVLTNGSSWFGVCLVTC